MAVTLYPSGHARRGHPVAVVLAVLLIPVGAGVYYFVFNGGQVTIAVTDDEIEQFTSLNVTFNEIRIHTTTAITPDAWVAVKLAQTTVDLSKLRNNISAVIGLARIPAGQYTQLRIIVQSADGVLTNGQRVLVQVPSGELTSVELSLVVAIEVPCSECNRVISCRVTGRVARPPSVANDITTGHAPMPAALRRNG